MPGSGGVKRSVARVRVQQEPYLLWNAFVDLLAKEDYADLSPLQRRAHLVFWYESEVQNGGHGQYFENRGVERVEETIDALKDLGLTCQAGVLSGAAAALSQTPRDTDWAEVLDESFVDDLDRAFYACTPSVIEALQEHLARYSTEYVEQI